jgi:medium-chain acyl-[acyl-carrier-protein] hydrolase
MLLFCFPYAGGSPYLFMDWKAQLQPEISVTALQLPGHGTRLPEPAHHSIETVLAEVMPQFPETDGRPFAFYGHSLGAVIALEVARQLRRMGRPQPCHLIVGGSRPPQLGPIVPHLHPLEEREFLSGVQARYSGIPAEVLNQPEILSLFLPALRADFTVYETHLHQPEAPLDLPISAFAGMDDPLVPEEIMTGWADHTSMGFDLQSLPGGHFFLQESRDALTSAIKHKLSSTC